MPTFKHPCPYCGKLIDRVVSACPYCAQVEPFSPKRCQTCRKIIEDPAWVVCPTCGASLIVVVAPVAGTGSGAAGAGVAGAGVAGGQPAPIQPATGPAQTQAQPPAAAVPSAPAGKCSGCGAPLPAGARFCTICGTMAG